MTLHAYAAQVASTTLAPAELVYPDAVYEAEAPPSCRRPAEVAKLMGSLIGQGVTESFAVAMLDSRHRVVAVAVVSTGTLNSALVHPREVFGPAIRLGTVAAIIVGHNHPSGDNTPSAEDEDVTRRLVDGGKLLGIPVLDHVIVCPDGAWCSLRESRPLCFN